jgi:hypothetical protein
MDPNPSLPAYDAEQPGAVPPAAFEDRKSFDPRVDAKVPLKRDPLSLAMRLGALTWGLLTSGHPGDLLVWARTMLQRRRPLSHPVPWLTFDATRAICAALPPGARVFEFGAGNSTIFWARRAASVCSVEDDAGWMALLNAKLKELRISNTHVLHETEMQAYVHTIGAWPDEHFDLVIVDGAWRRECVAAAVRHVKKGGMLVVDNTDWHWFRAERLAGIPPGWRRRVYAGYAPMIGYKSETTVFRRVD